MSGRMQVYMTSSLLSVSVQGLIVPFICDVGPFRPQRPPVFPCFQLKLFQSHKIRERQIAVDLHRSRLEAKEP